MKTVISVEHLSKQYDLGVISSGTLSRDLTRWWAKLRGKPDPFLRIGQRDAFELMGESILALNDVSFKVNQGEALGIIGRNGAGKSTLLKILSRVTAPSSGLVKVKGRIGSLLEVGTGFHQELTGRENVFLNGAILGMRKEEVSKKFDEIVDFSGVERFIDTPVKRYSSGMYVRLAFAVAAHLDPEILIVDEVLAVGDAEFQKKCLGKMGDVAGEGRTVLFVSHNMSAIQTLCSKALVLKSGSIVKEASAFDAIQFYLSESDKSSESRFLQNNHWADDKNASFTDAYLKFKNETYSSYAMVGQPMELVLKYKSRIDNGKIDFNVGIYSNIGEKITHFDSRFSAKEMPDLPNVGQVSCYIPKLTLTKGKYRVNLALYVNGILEDHFENAISFTIQDGDFYGTGRTSQNSQDKVFIDHQWKQ